MPDTTTTATKLLRAADAAAQKAAEALTSDYEHISATATGWATLANHYLQRHRVQLAAECPTCKSVGYVIRPDSDGDRHPEACPNLRHHPRT